MKNRLNIIIAALVGLGSIFTACSQDDGIVVANGDQKTPISFNVGIGSIPDPQVSTRGYTTDFANNSGYTFEQNDVVSIAVTHSGGSEVIKQYKVPSAIATPQGLDYKCESDGSSGTSFNWLSRSETLDLRAWSYGTADTPATDPNGATFTLATTQTGSVKELLYSPSDSYSFATNSGAISFPLYHQLARVVVNITGSVSADVTVNANGVTIGNSNLPTSATFTKPTSGNNYGSWSAQAGTGSVTAKACTTDGSNKATYAAVIIPYDGTQATPAFYGAGSKFIVIATSRGTYYYNIPAGGINFQPGKQYTFNITNLNQIDFNVTVSAWGAGASETLNFSN